MATSDKKSEERSYNVLDPAKELAVQGLTNTGKVIRDIALSYIENQKRLPLMLGALVTALAESDVVVNDGRGNAPTEFTFLRNMDSSEMDVMAATLLATVVDNSVTDVTNMMSLKDANISDLMSEEGIDADSADSVNVFKEVLGDKTGFNTANYDPLPNATVYDKEVAHSAFIRTDAFLMGLLRSEEDLEFRLRQKGFSVRDGDLRSSLIRFNAFIVRKVAEECTTGAKLDNNGVSRAKLSCSTVEKAVGGISGVSLEDLENSFFFYQSTVDGSSYEIVSLLSFTDHLRQVGGRGFEGVESTEES